jgi:hypothetical protein
MGGENLTAEELKQLHDLLAAFQASAEFRQVAVEPEDHEIVDGAMTLINYARTSRPESQE